MDRCLYMLYVKLSQGHMHTQTLYVYGAVS